MGFLPLNESVTTSTRPQKEKGNQNHCQFQADTMTTHRNECKGAAASRHNAIDPIRLAPSRRHIANNNKEGRIICKPPGRLFVSFILRLNIIKFSAMANVSGQFM